jgi:hypothetical protein
MAVRAVAGANARILLLNLRVEFAELDLLVLGLGCLVLLNFGHESRNLLIALLELGLCNLEFLSDFGDFRLLLV